MPNILQINYKFTVSRAEFESGFDRIAAEIAKVPGLRWKIWLLNEAESRGGGIYLFEDEQSVRAYLEGPIVAALKSSPVLTELNVQTFSVLEGPSAMTRGPIEESVTS
ncbi:MAG TPA: YdhR family protein [Terrimicrobiaceae bacterium]|nr:YdhR family protein [Terrimicrobiaceae bacterium]